MQHAPHRAAGRFASAAGLAFLLAACAEPTRLTSPEAAAAAAPSPAASLSSVVSAPDVTYGMLHGSFRLFNASIVGVGSGNFTGNDAYVQPGSSVHVQGNWQVGPVTNTGYCPYCIIEEYIAWVPNAAANGATPFNQGLWIGGTPYTNPNPGASGAYNWTTNAPTADGEYFIGSGGTLDYSFQWWAQGGLGGLTSNTATQAASYRVVVDGTPPDVTFTGAGSYDIAANVDVECTATDATSGVASSTCANTTGAGWTFGVGAHTVSATATDMVGNVGSGSATFTITVSADGMCALTTAWTSNAGVANSLCAKLRAAAAASNAGAHNGALGAYMNELSAQSGKKIAADKAALLTSYAQALLL